MDLADEFGLAIISADSRQIYRGFDIGTAKPTEAERERVPHFGIDIIDPTGREHGCGLRGLGDRCRRVD